MNFQDLKKITDMAIEEAERIEARSKETNDKSRLVQAHGALSFAGDLIMSERVKMMIDGTNEDVEEICKMEKLIYKKMSDIWEWN